jgi:hypothetical protein
MISQQELVMAQEHYWDLRHEADKERLIRQVRLANESDNRVYRRALSWLGGQLIAWGHGLQARYGKPATLISNHTS